MRWAFALVAAITFATFAASASNATPDESASGRLHEQYARLYSQQARLAAAYNRPWDAYRLERQAYLEAQAVNGALKRLLAHPSTVVRNGFAASSYGWGSI